ncbi:MAG: hypothetical protein C4570_08330 [Ammonifex sp.]|jgi:hypothetical protein|nr:MAG: hypothetical protein C4570_08330 [Ammonifex sp.]
MRKLEIDFEEIAAIMDEQDLLNGYYVDTLTGDLVVIPSELSELESFDKETIVELPEWERELIPVVQEIQEGSDRYELVPRVYSSEVYDLMVQFAETVSDRQLREKLEIALNGRGAFGRFKRVLGDYPEERERWFDWKLAKMSDWIREWLNELGIEPVQKKR